MGLELYHVIIVGGGAAGMAAAVSALQEMRKQKSTAGRGKVLLLESNDRVGKKLLATGNGKCNFTHKNISITHYHADDQAVLKSVLDDFPSEAALQFFEGMGMLSREKNGCFYPLSETASTVLDVLRLQLSELGCEIRCGIRIERAEKTKKGFVVFCRDGEQVLKIETDRLILATGSKAGGFLQDRAEDPLRIPKMLGLRSTALYPALTKCICREDYYYRQLAGVRAQVKLKLFCERKRYQSQGMERSVENRKECSGYSEDRKKAGKSPEKDRLSNMRWPEEKTGDVSGDWELLRQEAGELQLTKEGISGIAVFQLSGDIAQKLAEGRRIVVEINFLSDFQEDTLKEWIKERLRLLPGRSLEDFFLGVLHKKILGVCLQAEGLRGGMKIPEDDRSARQSGCMSANVISSEKTDKSLPAEKRAFMMISAVMKRAMHFTTEVTAVSDMKQAQVCRGGLFLSQFDKNLECKALSGLFACGEVLNVDGECGGYNLHFAWASGVLAGREAVRSISGDIS